jgi:hypothetical protein
MKRKVFIVFLVCEAVLCMLLYFVRETLPRVFTTLMAFPFEQIALGLRTLSLSGDTGNIIAIVLYSALCLIPVAVLLLSGRKRNLHPEDILLVILSAVLFAVVYLMINPGMISPYLGSTDRHRVGKAILGSMVYSVLLGYVILRVLRFFSDADIGRLQKYLSALLSVLNVLFIYLAFGACLGSLMDSLDGLRAGNTGNEQHLGMSYIFLVLQYMVNALPYILNVLVVFASLNLLKELSTDRYCEAAVTAARKLSHLCKTVLAITVVSNISYNLLQLVFIKRLLMVNSSVQIPLLSIAFVLAALLLAQYIKENKQLKDDNDMFI